MVMEELRCYNCSGVRHFARDCPLKTCQLKTCYKCNGLGHLRYVCPNASRRRSNIRGGWSGSYRRFGRGQSSNGGRGHSLDSGGGGGDLESVPEQLVLDKRTSQLETEQLGDQIREQDRKLHSVTVERDLLLNKVTSANETIKKLEEQQTTASSSTHLYTAKVGTLHTESQIVHLKTVAAAAQRSRDDLHNKLSEVNMELELVKQRNNSMEKQFTEQDNELHVLTMEIKTFEERFKEQKLLSKQKDQEVASLRKELHNAERMVGLKDADNQEILYRYRELDRLAREECERMAREAKIRLEQQDRLHAQNEKLEQHIDDMELQVNEYRRLVNEYADERKRIILDLETEREINSKIEGQREAHAGQAANSNRHCQQKRDYMTGTYCT